MARRRTGVVAAVVVLAALLAWRLTPSPRPDARRASAARHVESTEETTAREPTPPAARDAKPAAARLPLVFPPQRERRPVALEIRVVDADGSPADGATVRVLRATREGWTDLEPVALLRADAEGRARVEVSRAPDFRVHAILDGREGWTDRVSTSGETVVRLEELLPVRGRVLDENGRPVPAAEVVLSLEGPIQGPGSFDRAHVSVTNADGETVIPRRPTHRRPYYRVTARGYATAWGELDRDSLLGSGFEVRLARLATVVGRLVDEAGRPVPNVQVFVVETLQSTRSGSDGRFTLHALPLDGGTITAEPRGYGIVHLDNVRPRGEPTDLGDIRLGAGLSITGRVFGVEGTPANGVYVWSRDVGTGLSARAAPTDAQGRFEIAGLADRAYALTTHARGQPPPGKTAPSAKLASVPAGAQGVVLRLLARPVLGIALVATGSTESLWVRRLEVVATRREGGARVEKEAESKQRKRRVAGTVVVLPAEGTYDVVVRAPGHGEANFEVAIGPDEMRTFSVELPRGEDG